VSFTAGEKLNIAQALLDQLRIDRIEVASARVSAGEQAGVRAITEWAAQHGHLDKVEVLGFVDGTHSVDWIVAAGGKVLNLLTKGSEKHCTRQLGKTLQQHADEVLQVVTYARSKGLHVNAYLEDWSNGYKDNKDYVFGLLQADRRLRHRAFHAARYAGCDEPGRSVPRHARHAHALPAAAVRFPSAQ